MKQVKIKKVLFNEIIKTIQGAVAVDNSRPVLKKCKCEVDEKFIKFNALDGYCATIVKVEHNCKDVEHFEFLFDTFKVDSDKAGVQEITIEKLEGCTSFSWLDNNSNQIERIEKDFGVEYIDIDKIYKNSRSNDSKTITFHANLLIRMLKGFAKKTGDLVDITFDKNNSTSPIFIKSSKSFCGEIEALVLPCRNFENE